ncbi:hypothetical protein [Fibrobacter intestinalis]|uniref:hypothetical protein n=1 Tax=Fibrobacter TaxID=832 RepID=UPI00099B05D7|nr:MULTISPECIES: hypothetical protein [Fibrobacter]
MREGHVRPAEVVRDNGAIDVFAVEKVVVSPRALHYEVQRLDNPFLENALKMSARSSNAVKWSFFVSILTIVVLILS